MSMSKLLDASNLFKKYSISNNNSSNNNNNNNNSSNNSNNNNNSNNSNSMREQQQQQQEQQVGSYGRVVRLHFACRADLPMGSSLRVTSSQLWAPSSSSMNDEEDSTTYASSVEMVTSPEEWPVWRTRGPVVVVLRHHHSRVEQHRYRYMVVTPGAHTTTTPTLDGETTVHVVTSLEGTEGGAEVMAWEDPFSNPETLTEMKHTPSASSLQSVIASKTLANLPYRTINIDTKTAEATYSSSRSQEETAASSSDDEEFTGDGVWIDNWNQTNDRSFSPYVLRDGINKQNKHALQPSAAAATTTLDTTTLVPIKNAVSFSKLPTMIPTSDAEDAATLSTTSSMIHMPSTPKTSSGILSNPNVGATSNKQRIFFVCYHLPVIVSRDPITHQWSAVWAESLLAATEGSCVVRSHDAYWVGTVSCASHAIDTPEDQDAVSSVLEEMNCHALFLPKSLQEAHYFGMCKQVLWPAFHNIDLLDLSSSGWIEHDTTTKGSSSTSKGDTVADDASKKSRFNFFHNILKRSKKLPTTSTPSSSSDWDQSRLDDWWNAYQKVNQAFAETLVTQLKFGDIMWVHDYHLSLVPKLVDDREMMLHNQSLSKKVFFLHIPFPTSQVFRELECGDVILGGILHANVIGFHAFDHARHFLNASKRILGLSYERLPGGLIGVKFRKKIVLVTMHNVSVEPGMVDAALGLPAVIEKNSLLCTKYSSRVVIAGVDIAQRLSGISLKLLAFERFLTDYPAWQEKVVLVQKCLLPGTRRDDETNTIREVRYLVKRIKAGFGPSVLDCDEIVGKSLPIVERLALWKAADVLMVTPIREGLNLLPFEYVFARKKPSSPGVVICSEFAAVSSVLNGALRVNPFDIQMTVVGIDKALTLNAEEKEGRRFRDEAFVKSSPSSEWTKSVLHDLNDAMNLTNRNFDDNESEDTGIICPKYDRKNLITSTASFLAREKEMSFSQLDVNAVLEVYKTSKNRVIILDLNGTVIDKENAGIYLKGETFCARGNKPHQKVCQALKALCSDPRNTVFVVSGDSKKNVVDAIGNIPGLGLAASNGACFAPPLKPGESNRQWKYFDLGVDWDAVKKIVLPVFAKYTARTNGSVIKVTHSSIGWSYYSCDPEWGSLQASQLVIELEESLGLFDVRFVMIKGIVEIVPRRLNKGLIVNNVLRERHRKEAAIDFILCMGDDIHDEKMFTSVFSFIAEIEDPTHAPMSLPVVDDAGAVISPSISRSEDGTQCNLEEELPALVDLKISDNPLSAFTVAVGKKESHAFAYVDYANEVGSLLIQLSGIAK